MSKYLNMLSITTGSVTSDEVSRVVYLGGRDVESTGAQVYSLPLVNEGQHEDNTRAFGRTNSTQTKHDYPLVVWHCL